MVVVYDGVAARKLAIEVCHSLAQSLAATCEFEIMRGGGSVILAQAGYSAPRRPGRCQSGPILVFLGTGQHSPEKLGTGSSDGFRSVKRGRRAGGGPDFTSDEGGDAVDSTRDWWPNARIWITCRFGSGVWWCDWMAPIAQGRTISRQLADRIDRPITLPFVRLGVTNNDQFPNCSVIEASSDNPQRCRAVHLLFIPARCSCPRNDRCSPIPRRRDPEAQVGAQTF